MLTFCIVLVLVEALLNIVRPKFLLREEKDRKEVDQVWVFVLGALLGVVCAYFVASEVHAQKESFFGHYLK